MVMVAQHSEPKLYTIAEAAKRLGVNYQRIKYGIANRWLVLYQENPDLITEDELFSFALERKIEIPEL